MFPCVTASFYHVVEIMKVALESEALAVGSREMSSSRLKVFIHNHIGYQREHLGIKIDGFPQHDNPGHGNQAAINAGSFTLY
jgi:hypothetical protein